MAGGYVCSCCGKPITEDNLGFNYTVPSTLWDLSDEECEDVVVVNTDAVLTTRGFGNYFRVILPVRLDDGRTVTFGVWVEIHTPDEFTRVLDYCREPEDPPSLTFQGTLSNSVAPWQGKTMGATVTSALLEPRKLPRITGGDPPVLEVLNGSWSARDVLASRQH
jgi:hypothetical protein